MKRIFKQFICFTICLSIAVTSFSVMALTQAEKDKINNDSAGLRQQASVIQAEIDKLKAEINSAKNKRICPKCGAAIDQISNYCNACGAKLFYDSEEDKTEE